eukprot:gene10131-21128_t
MSTGRKTRRSPESGTCAITSAPTQTSKRNRRNLSPSPDNAPITPNATDLLTLYQETVDLTVPKEPPNIMYFLPDLILGTILFSGYFNSMFVCKSVIRVCKTFSAIAKRSIFALDLRATTIRNENIFSLTSNLASNLVYLDLGYTPITDGFGAALQTNCSQTLRGLSLRGTFIGNNTLQYIGQLHHLRSLDIAKSSQQQSYLITDIGIQYLFALEKLEWLNLSWNSMITDTSISQLCTHTVCIEHLGLGCCVSLTDACMMAVSRLKLKTLDISGCKDISSTGLWRLWDMRSETRVCLENLMCSFLSVTSDVTVQDAIQNLTNLKKLEMRRTNGAVWVGLSTIEEAKRKLSVAIFSHND